MHFSRSKLFLLEISCSKICSLTARYVENPPLFLRRDECLTRPYGDYEASACNEFGYLLKRKEPCATRRAIVTLGHLSFRWNRSSMSLELLSKAKVRKGVAELIYLESYHLLRSP